MEKLKPCPFCGSSVAVRVLDQNEVEYREEGDSDYADHPCYQVVCCMNDDSPVPTTGWVNGCGAAGGFRKTPEEAIAAWNRRTAPENSPLTLEQLHQMDSETVWIVTEGKCYPRTITHSDSGMLHLCNSDGWLSILNESNHSRLWTAFAERPKEKPPTDGNL